VTLETWSFVVSTVALACSGYAIVVSKNVARRTGVIDLHNAWNGVNDLDPTQMIGPDVRSAVNALELTATVWNHDVIEKNIVFQSYWEDFKRLYDVLLQCHTAIPGYRKTGNEFLTPNIRKAYHQMEQWALSGVKQTRL